LLTDELALRAPSPDAIIIVGPKVSLEQKVPLDLLKESGAASRPIFYLNYNPDPVDESGPDSIGSALKASTGALTYDMSSPATWELPCAYANSIAVRCHFVLRIMVCRRSMRTCLGRVGFPN
jgi:hypothetical protein